MPHLELTELECKMLWLILDRAGSLPDFPIPVTAEAMGRAECSLFAKVYAAYRRIPEAA